MHSDWETFITAYNNASADIQALIDSEVIALFVDSFITKYSIAPQHKRALMALFSDLILALTTAEETVSQLQQIRNFSDAEKQQLIVEMKQFAINPQRPLDVSGKVQTNTTTTPPEPQKVNCNITTSMPQENISPLRTMRGDAERIHGYGAYRTRQDTDKNIPKPADKSQLADMPRYSNE